MPNLAIAQIIKNLVAVMPMTPKCVNWICDLFLVLQFSAGNEYQADKQDEAIQILLDLIGGD